MCRSPSRPLSLRKACLLVVALLTLLAAVGPLARSAAAAGPSSAAPPAASSADDDLTTPRRALAVFLEASSRGDWERASAVLDVKPAAGPARIAKAVEQARQLHFLLTRNVWLDLDDLSDDMAGRQEDGADTERIGLARLDDRDVPLTMKLVKGDPPRWVFSATTLARVPELYAQIGPSAIEQRMPERLRVMALGMAAWQWLGLLVATLLGVAVGRALSWVVLGLAARVAARTRVAWDDDLVAAIRAPARWLITLVLFRAGAKLLAMPTAMLLIVIHITGTLFVVALAWMAIRATGVVAVSLERRATRDSIDLAEAVLKARGVRTQVRVLRRVLDMAVMGVAGALILMQFEVMRSIGVSLLASAGVAGIVLGLAAQRTIGSIIAGIQLSVTQPIRIGDAVFIENEFGTIEEITLTYVVVKVWDERRLIVPMTRFFEQPFQNWTKSSAQLHGTVMLYADWTLPVPALRQALERILEGKARWDRRTKTVHVTAAKEQVIEVRVLVSAADADRLFDLRAEVREELIAWLQAFEGGRHLPRYRSDEPGVGPAVGSGEPR